MVEKQQVRRKRTLIKFGVETTIYTDDEGADVTYELLSVPVGIDDNDNEIVTDCFYCEWLGSYGANAIQQQADGVMQPARVRMPFVKAVYDALQSKSTKIYLYGIDDPQHTYCLNSAVDNYLENNKLLEFQVKRYEVK